MVFQKKMYSILPPLFLYAGEGKNYFIVKDELEINRKELKGQL